MHPGSAGQGVPIGRALEVDQPAVGALDQDADKKIDWDEFTAAIK